MKLHTRVTGDGPKTAVFVHGGLTDGRMWDRVAGRLAAEHGYTVLAPDLRGHGASPRGAYSIEAWAADLVESLPSEPDLALGHSLGGTVLSVAVGELRPARAVYADPGFEHDVVPAEAIVGMRPVLEATTADDVRAAHPRWADEDVDAYLAALSLCDLDLLDTVAELSRTGTNYVPETALVPSLLLLADVGSCVRPESAQLLATRGFAVARVAGAGHSIHLDDPDGFLDALRGWI